MKKFFPKYMDQKTKEHYNNLCEERGVHGVKELIIDYILDTSEDGNMQFMYDIMRTIDNHIHKVYHN